MDAGTAFLALGLVSIARGGSLGPCAMGGVGIVVALCAILCDSLCKLVLEFGKFRRYAGGGGAEELGQIFH